MFKSFCILREKKENHELALSLKKKKLRFYFLVIFSSFQVSYLFDGVRKLPFQHIFINVQVHILILSPLYPITNLFWYSYWVIRNHHTRHEHHSGPDFVMLGFPSMRDWCHYAQTLCVFRPFLVFGSDFIHTSFEPQQ